MAAATAYAVGIDGMRLLDCRDPGEAVAWQAVIEGAYEIREREREATAVATANAVGKLFGGR